MSYEFILEDEDIVTIDFSRFKPKSKNVRLSIRSSDRARKASLHFYFPAEMLKKSKLDGKKVSVSFCNNYSIVRIKKSVVGCTFRQSLLIRNNGCQNLVDSLKKAFEFDESIKLISCDKKINVEEGEITFALTKP